MTNIKNRGVSFNLDDPEQSELYSYCDNFSNFSGYVKGLIIADRALKKTATAISNAAAVFEATTASAVFSHAARTLSSKSTCSILRYPTKQYEALPPGRGCSTISATWKECQSKLKHILLLLP
ncbi:hypothetical protein ACT7CW_06410 [Bacillus pacificus]